MKLTEKKLRRIIRSVLIETYGKRKEPDSYQDVIRADLKSAFDDIQGLNSSRLPTHDTYTDYSDEASNICRNVLGFVDPDCLRVVSAYLEDGNRSAAMTAAREFALKHRKNRRY